MNTRNGKWLWVALIAMGLGLLGRRVDAQQPDTMTLSVTPGGILYSVQITSVNTNGYQFGTVNLAATTVSTAAITVANTGGGNVAEYFGMKVTNVSGDWTPQSVAPSTDTFRLTGAFGANQPVQGGASFVTTNAITGSFPGTAAGLYTQGGKTLVGNNQKLWLQLEMPTSLTNGTGGAETLTLYIEGQSS